MLIREFLLLKNAVLSSVISNVKNGITQYHSEVKRLLNSGSQTNEGESNAQQLGILHNTPQKRKEFIKSQKTKDKLQVLRKHLPTILEPENVIFLYYFITYL